uniref:G-protein coupled receptors family 1 profile domain-containing protein n=1 Tax=Sinocyclocheilus grahami TaxID=75366 RepID=A0A672KNB6_SINGR
MGSDNGNTSLNIILSNNISVTFGALILSIVFLLGVPGNLFIIWSILARARKRSVTTLLILNLACADGCLMCLTIFFIIYLAKQNWIFGSVMCKLLFYLCNTNMYASIMIITLMSLHRLVAVMWPTYLTACTRRRTVLLVLGGLWIVVFLLALPALIFREEIKNDNGKERTVCATHHKSPKHVSFYAPLILENNIVYQTAQHYTSYFSYHTTDLLVSYNQWYSKRGPGPTRGPQQTTKGGHRMTENY